MLDNFKRATGPEMCVCGRDVIISKILAPSFRDLHLFWWHTNLFLSQSGFFWVLCVVWVCLGGFPNSACIKPGLEKCPNLYKAAPHRGPSLSASFRRQTRIFFFQIKNVSLVQLKWTYPLLMFALQIKTTEYHILRPLLDFVRHHLCSKT